MTVGPCCSQSKWSENFNDFIASCLVKDANKRPTAKMLLGHPFVRRYATWSTLPTNVLFNHAMAPKLCCVFLFFRVCRHTEELMKTGRSIALASFVDLHLAAVSARRKKTGSSYQVSHTLLPARGRSFTASPMPFVLSLHANCCSGCAPHNKVPQRTPPWKQTHQ